MGFAVRAISFSRAMTMMSQSRTPTHIQASICFCEHTNIEFTFYARLAVRADDDV